MKSDIGPVGIGGWLILPALGLVISPIVRGFMFFRYIVPTLDASIWKTLSDPSSAVYHPLWVPMILFEAVSSIVIFAFTLWLGYLFFVRISPLVPRVFIVWLACHLIAQIIDVTLINSIPLAAEKFGHEALTGLGRSVVSAAIWIPYFLRSQRVKNTFTNAAAASASAAR